MQFFTSPQDLSGWVKSHPSATDAANKLIDIFKENNSGEEDVVETCTEIFKEDEDGNASKMLFGVLAKHNITQVKSVKSVKGVKGAKGAKNMNKEAQAVQSRQRNNWVRGDRNKWNRVVDGFNEGTPWRVDRDKFYNFTHYYTDDIRFDEDPQHVYSGEAIWRMYVMDKFTADYQDKDGRVVGGYINDRFYRFPDAGTPANPDVDRLHGNQMELAAGERTRKPRPHQYSVERRMEEARGNKTEDLEAVVAQSKSVVKLASNLPKEAKNDKVYSIFKDTIEMREAGIEYPLMLEAIADHYNASIMGVAQIDKVAQDLKKKHSDVVYVKEAQYEQPNPEERIVINPNGVKTIDGKTIPTQSRLLLERGTTDVYTVKDQLGNVQGKVRIPVMLDGDVTTLDIQQGADETGLLENPNPEVDFPVEEVAPQGTQDTTSQGAMSQSIPQNM